MTSLQIAHLILVSTWACLVVAEFTIELTQDDERAAPLHYRLDLLMEAPLLVSIVATGAFLIPQAGPFDALLITKIVAGLGAVLSAAVCIVFVVLRKRQIERSETVEALSRRIRLTGAGLPLGILAAYIGLTYYM